MGIIQKNRTIRPSSRQSASKYRVNVENAQQDEIIHINIDHESKPFKEIYIIKARDLNGKKSLYFTVEENGDSVKVIWTGEILPAKK